MTRDRNGNEIDAFGIPTGPINEQPTACYHADGTFKGFEDQEVILLDALRAAGVELGDYDRRMVRHFSQFFDWPMLATVTSWINRANERNPQ